LAEGIVVQIEIPELPTRHEIRDLVRPAVVGAQVAHQDRMLMNVRADAPFEFMGLGEVELNVECPPVRIELPISRDIRRDHVA
jgi:hypothetical protein